MRQTISHIRQALRSIIIAVVGDLSAMSPVLVPVRVRQRRARWR